MNYKSHLLVFMLVFVFIYYVYWYLQEAFSFQQLLVLIPIGLFFTLLPDIDNPVSKVRKLVTKLFLSLSLILLAGFVFLKEPFLLAAALILLMILFLLTLTKHRGRFHKISSGLFLSVPFLFLGLEYFVVAFAAYLTHLIAD